jgi:hypothetical protein
MLLCIILLSVCTGATIKTTAKRDSLSIAYYTFIGVHELTGHNDGAQVNKFQAATGNKTGDSWCASFVAFCLKLVGIKQIANGMARSWFDKAHTVWKLNVHGVKRFYELAGYKGNTGGFYFQSHHAIAHIFFIDAIKDDAVIIVSGNTNDAVSREGNCVAQAKVKIKSIHAVSNWIK